MSLAVAAANAADPPDTNSPAGAEGVTNASGRQVIAYYFHGTVRCETCLEIEKQAHDFIQRRYQSELDAKRLVFQAVNYDKPDDAHFLRDYKLPCPSLVLVRQESGKDVKWKVLGQTWTLVETPAAFDQYVEKEVGIYMSEVSNSAVTTNSAAKEPLSESTPGKTVESLAEMNALFGDLNAAFVFVHATNGSSSINWVPLNRTRRALESEWDIKVGLFELRPNPSDYRRLAERHVFSLPTVMIVLQNGTTTMYSGELTETNLLREFTYTLSSGGCCALGEQ